MKEKWKIPTPKQVLKSRGRKLKETKYFEGKKYKATCPFCQKNAMLTSYTLGAIEFWLCKKCFKEYKK